MVAPPTAVVVGAGLSGLLAAGRLAAAGVAVSVVDKGRGVGGRLATRRVGPARFDHGAQFFTVRAPDFAALAAAWAADGVAREWCRGFRQPPDGHPRYVGDRGMTSLAKAAATSLDVAVATRVEAVRAVDDGWVVDAGPGDPPRRADAVVLTAPVPQSLALLDAGGVVVPAARRQALEAVRYDPTLAVLVSAADGATTVPAPGGLQFAPGDGILSWIGDNQAKGVSPVPAVTLHVGGATSAAWWDEPTDTVVSRALDAAEAWVGPAAGHLAVEVARWRYATPVTLHDDRCLVVADGPQPLVCAGDAFGEAKVEGAARSGWAAADAVLDRLAGR